MDFGDQGHSREAESANDPTLTRPDPDGTVAQILTIEASMRTISNGDTLVFVDFDNLSGPTAGLFREFLRATLKPEHRNVELDLSRATFMDSEGLGAVMSAHKAVAGRGGGVRIKGAPPMIRELFRITRLDTLIEFTPPA